MRRPPSVTLIVLAVGACCMVVSTLLAAGVAALSAAAGTSATPSDVGALRRPAVPSPWRVQEAVSVQGCQGLDWEVLGSLGWLATRSGRSVGNPPWWAWVGGPFGLVPGEGGAPVDLAASADHATSTLCRAMVSSGGLEAGLVALTGTRSSATTILALASALAATPDLSAGRATVLAAAAGAIGVPYRWGGNGPDGFDCSGLVVAAFRTAGVVLSRTAQSQHDAAQITSGDAVPGDLVFFGSGPRDVSHVGIILGHGLMIDAPHTGAFVRIEAYDWPDLLDHRDSMPIA